MMRQHWRGTGALALSVALGLSLGACQDQPDVPVLQGTETALPPDHPDISQMPAQVPQGGGGPVGVVLETMDSGGYTYALLNLDGAEIWSAGPPTEIAVGDSIDLTGAMGMQDFHSSTLDRTFDQILFLGAFNPPMGGAVSGATFAGNRGLVTETMSAAGYTYALVEIAGQSMWLAGPETVMAVGDSVGWMDGSLMRDFSSATLDRTWDIILFVDRFAVLN